MSNVFFDTKNSSILDFVMEDGRGRYRRRTLEQFNKEYIGQVVIMDGDEAWERYNEAGMTAPVEVTSTQWFEALECLPPQRWKGDASAESFYMMEFSRGDVTTHYVRLGDRYFSLKDYFTKTHDEVVAACKEQFK